MVEMFSHLMKTANIDCWIGYEKWEIVRATHSVYVSGQELLNFHFDAIKIKFIT